jgi:hypothetical protein
MVIELDTDCQAQGGPDASASLNKKAMHKLGFSV